MITPFSLVANSSTSTCEMCAGVNESMITPFSLANSRTTTCEMCAGGMRA